MKKVLNLLLVVLSFSLVDVYATNDVDYHLTITDDYKFQEVITYSISDYQKVDNGDNHFYDVINTDIYTDILGKTKYNKTVKQQNNKYIVVLSHTYSELTFSNANFMNNCFQKPEFTYDVDKYVFNSSSGFNCLYGDSLKITVTTNKTVAKSNGNKSGNSYIWFPPSAGQFKMQYQINKTYDQVQPADEDEVYDDIDEDGLDNNQEEGQDVTPDGEEEDEGEVIDDGETDKTKHHTNPYIILVTSGIVVGALIFVAITLKIKKDRINRL